MEKFNNTTLFTGYLKQLLHDFNLPTYRVYTSANRKYLEKYGKESPEIIETVTKNKSGDITYPSNMHYVSYIKDNRIQEYINGKWVKKGTTNQEIGSHYHFYTYGDKVLNYTKNLELRTNIYDSYTHEYLGDYLRFQRDYNNINLMPLYNCFSNRTAENLDLQIKFKKIVATEESGTKEKEIVTKIDFKNNERYKIYAVPVKLFKEYTIAIDSEMPIELCCGMYNKRLDDREKFESLPALTYQKIRTCFFSQPFVYNKLVNLGVSKATLTDLAQNEDNLTLFIKLPINNTSTIVVLEGNYLNWNDTKYLKLPKEINKVIVSHGEGTIPAGEQYSHKINVPSELSDEELLALYNEFDVKVNEENPKLKDWARQTNYSVINFDDITDDIPFELRTPLQLLMFNTGEQHPFADRLIEYLIGNVITNEDEISANIKRAQRIMNNNTSTTGVRFETEGLWSDSMREIAYDFINRGCSNTQTNNFDINHDILGYIDKDVEKNYTSVKVIWSGKGVDRKPIKITRDTILSCELEEDK